MALEEQAKENIQNRIVQEGIALWNRQKDAAFAKKLQEQREMREMLDKYWPWGSNGPKPRGLRNLRLEGIFPNKDLQKAKRLVGPLGFGREGGGAPVLTHSGRRVIRTREDPIIRFQWSKDLRRCVDNTLRYKTDREQREIYKRQLDAQVAERKIREQQNKRDSVAFHKRSFLKSPPWGKPGPGGTIWRPPGNIGINFLKSLGWSTENTLKAMTGDMDADKYRDSILKEYEDFKKLSMQPVNTTKYEYPITPWRQNEELFKMRRYGSPRLQSPADKQKLSPLNKNNVNGEELVPLLAKQRAIPLKIPLGTTDVTRGNPEKRKPGNRNYLQELTNQMENKQQRIKAMKTGDIDVVRRHFEALDDFWGKPGNGAPRNVIKKGCLDRLLHDHTVFVREAVN